MCLMRASIGNVMALHPGKGKPDAQDLQALGVQRLVSALESITGSEAKLSKWSVSNIDRRYPHLFSPKDPNGPFRPLSFHSEFLQDLTNRIARIRSSIDSKSITADACSDPHKRCGNNGGVAAYTTPGGKTIWVCPVFFTLSETEQAGIILHEYSHLAAYTRDELTAAQEPDYALAWPNRARWAYFYDDIPIHGLDGAIDRLYINIERFALSAGHVK